MALRACVDHVGVTRTKVVRVSSASDFTHLQLSVHYLPSASFSMDVSIALVGKGYVLVASDTTQAHSIVKMKSDEDKMKILGPHLVMAYTGEPGVLYTFN